MTKKKERTSKWRTVLRWRVSPSGLVDLDLEELLGLSVEPSDEAVQVDADESEADDVEQDDSLEQDEPEESDSVTNS